MRIYLDVHDTLADLQGKLAGKNSDWLHQQTSSWWSKLKRTSYGSQIVEACIAAVGAKGIYACTKLSTPNCAKGTFEWIRREYPFLRDQIVMCHDKSLLANADSILIDDYACNCAEFEESGGNIILVPTPYNGYPALNTVFCVEQALQTILRSQDA